MSTSRWPWAARTTSLPGRRESAICCASCFPQRVDLFAEHEALDGSGAAGRSVAIDHGGAHAGVVAGGFELARHAGEEAVEHQLLLNADHAVIRAAHADVGLVGGASGEHAFVGGGDV